MGVFIVLAFALGMAIGAPIIACVIVNKERGDTFEKVISDFVQSDESIIEISDHYVPVEDILEALKPWYKFDNYGYDANGIFDIGIYSDCNLLWITYDAYYGIITIGKRKPKPKNDTQSTNE